MSRSNVVSSIQYLKLAQEFMDDLVREKPDSIGAKIFKKYSEKISWIFKDLITNTLFTKEISDAIKKEINSDVFVLPAIMEKVSLLKPEQREIIEATIDCMINGEDVKIIDIKDETQ